MRQFGYVQDIPLPLLAILFEGIDRWFLVMLSAMPAPLEIAQCRFSSMRNIWMILGVDPRIIQPRQHEDDVGPSHVGGPSDDMLLPPHGADDQQRQ